MKKVATALSAVPAWLCLASLSLAAAAAHAAPKLPQNLVLTAGARVGVVNLLDPEVTHYHASRQLQDSYLKTYPVNWPVSAMLMAAVSERLAQLGLAAVAVSAPEDLSRARENCFLNATLAKGLPKECVPLYTQLGAAERLAAIVILGPGLNDSAHADGTRHRELPEYLRGWCFASGEGGTGGAPVLLSLTELLLVGVTPRGAELDARQWGGNGQSWTGYQPPADLRAIPAEQLDQLRPLFGAMLRQQAGALLNYLQVSR